MNLVRRELALSLLIDVRCATMDEFSSEFLSDCYLPYLTS